MERFVIDQHVKKRDKVKDRKVIWNVTITAVGWYFPSGDRTLSVANADVSLLPATKSGATVEASVTNTTDS